MHQLHLDQNSSRKARSGDTSAVSNSSEPVVCHLEHKVGEGIPNLSKMQAKSLLKKCSQSESKATTKYVTFAEYVMVTETKPTILSSKQQVIHNTIPDDKTNLKQVSGTQGTLDKPKEQSNRTASYCYMVLHYPICIACQIFALIHWLTRSLKNPLQSQSTTKSSFSKKESTVQPKPAQKPDETVRNVCARHQENDKTIHQSAVPSTHVDILDTLFTRRLTKQFELVAQRSDTLAKSTLIEEITSLLGKLPKDNLFILKWHMTRLVVTPHNYLMFAQMWKIDPAVLRMLIDLGDSDFYQLILNSCS